MHSDGTCGCGMVCLVHKAEGHTLAVHRCEDCHHAEKDPAAEAAASWHICRALETPDALRTALERNLNGERDGLLEILLTTLDNEALPPEVDGAAIVADTLRWLQEEHRSSRPIEDGAIAIMRKDAKRLMRGERPLPRPWPTGKTVMDLLDERERLLFIVAVLRSNGVT